MCEFTDKLAEALNITPHQLTAYYAIAVTIIALIYMFFDVHYFYRVFSLIRYGRIFQKEIKITDMMTVYGACTTHDLDIVFRHMNNARFVRELDFARYHFYDRTGLYRIITGAKAHALQTACNIRYRRTIPLFSMFKITTKCLYWDEKTLYLEQQFITLGDGFVRAISLSKQNVIGLNVAEVMAKLLGKSVDYRPEIPEELKLWISSMEASSLRLRSKDD